MAIPKAARPKIVKPRSWTWDEPARTVYLEPVGLDDRSKPNRKFNVYATDGTQLGCIQEYQSSIDTPIRGTRLVRRGKRRTFWAVNGRDFWRHLPSQADAIRQLLDEAR